MRNTIESFNNEANAIVRLNELVTAGVPEEDVTVIVDKKPDDSILADKREVNYKEANGSFGNKFSSFFSSSDPEEKVLKNLELSDTEKNRYTEELKAGKVLLYAKNKPAAETTGQVISQPGSKKRSNHATEAEKGMTADGLYAADKPNDGIHAEPNTKDQVANELNKDRK
ncbi:general stress protein [Terribacillus sp. DMT04]|uniref:general stress protein n=1 Tax=Terribacillus sp. DMT04 TaxID=2850441 RepID=UPI001C2C491D|nr:general stress protein [Terribacillus sp. DMT04]QXE00719.1 general stress protein [Terribacillus sp. DMT04]